MYHSGLTYLQTYCIRLSYLCVTAVCSVRGMQGRFQMKEYGCGRYGVVYLRDYYLAPNSTEGLGDQSRGACWN